MLKQLYIKNFTLIDELNIKFAPGFSVVTGETGAGKSIVLGAVGLLLGARADVKTIRNGEERSVIKAHFDISRYDFEAFFNENDIEYDAEDCIIRREINSKGKSRAFINDTPVPLVLTKEIGEQLVDIHSQHQNLMLNQDGFQLNVIDTIACDKAQLAEYKETFAKYKNAVSKLNKLKEDILKANENEDFLRFQYKELSEAQLVDGEQDTLETELSTLEHSEEIKSALYTGTNMLIGEDNGIVDSIKNIASQIHSIEHVYPEILEIASRIDSAYIELKDISQEINSYYDSINFDPQKLEALNMRLNTIYSLEHKFHVDTVKELLDIQSDLNKQLNSIDNSEEKLNEQEEIVNNLRTQSIAKAKIISKLRGDASKVLEQEMLQRLIPLGIPDVRFSVQLEEKQLSENGADKIVFLFSANKSTPLLLVSQVASGGEIARVMLALKAIISNKIKLPTIIFDEIDIGVSGRIAEKMAHIMQEMGDNNRQVISITHLPQIAAMGSTHYKVSKEETPMGTVSKMVKLTSQQRINEIAQMLSGSSITDAAINNAKSLLKL